MPATGHTSWTTSGMAYLSFWAAGKLRCFNGGGHPWRLVVSGAPTGLAAWVGFTRLQASWEGGSPGCRQAGQHPIPAGWFWWLTAVLAPASYSRDRTDPFPVVEFCCC